MRFLVFFLFFSQLTYGQRLSNHLDTLYRPTFNFTSSGTDYVVIYQRVRGIRLKITKKMLDEGNDWRVRVKLTDRFRVICDFICSDFNPDNFFYSSGITFKL